MQSVQPSVQIMINTLPFGPEDYENARDLTFGQRLESLAGDVVIFEVMTYHQILNRQVDWIPIIGNEVRRRTEKKTVCTSRWSHSSWRESMPWSPEIWMAWSYLCGPIY
jgi:hypothetical protein